MQDTIILLTEAEEEEQRLKEKLAEVELKVGALLAKLSDERLYDFMVNRFLDFMTIEAAANEVGFSYSWGAAGRGEGRGGGAAEEPTQNNRSLS